MKKILFGYLAFITLSSIAHGQERLDTKIYPIVGKLCPDVTLHNIAYYKKKQAKISDFRGQWLVLDFWNKNCGSCVASFPETNAMQRKFQGKVQFMLVGIQDPEGEIETMYKAFRKRERLVIPCDFDSLLSNDWAIYNCPHIIVVDDKGIVQAITNMLDSTDVQTLLEGSRPVLAGTYTSDQSVIKVPVNFDSNDFILRSVFTKWNPSTQTQHIPHQIDMYTLSPKLFPKGNFQLSGMPLSFFYYYAFFGVSGWWGSKDTALYGKVSNKLILDIKDSSLFQYSYRGDGKNLFAYSLTLPPNRCSKEEMEKAMQEDLERIFGFKTSIENRLCECWKLVARPNADRQLKTKGGQSKLNWPITRVRITMTNEPEKTLVKFVGDFLRDIPLIDETGITSNIDITLDCIDFDQLRASLRKYGLDLVPGEKLMKVIVVRDADSH